MAAAQAPELRDRERVIRLAFRQFQMCTNIEGSCQKSGGFHQRKAPGGVVRPSCKEAEGRTQA